MDHIVKLTSTMMASGDDWRLLIFELDPAAPFEDVVEVELTVKNVFFGLST